MSIRKTRLERAKQGQPITAKAWNTLLDRMDRLDGGAGQRTGNFDAGGVKKLSGEFAGSNLFVQLEDDLGGEDSDWCNKEAKVVTWDRDAHEWKVLDRTVPVMCDAYRPIPYAKGTRLLVHYHEQAGKFIPEGMMNAQVARTLDTDDYPDFDENDPANTFPIKFGRYSFPESAGKNQVDYEALPGDDADGYVLNLHNCPEKTYIPAEVDIPVVGLWTLEDGEDEASVRWYTWVEACVEDSSSASSGTESSDNATSSLSTSVSRSLSSSLSTSASVSFSSSISRSFSSSLSSNNSSLSSSQSSSVSFSSSVSTSVSASSQDCFVYSNGRSEKRDGCCVLILQKLPVVTGGNVLCNPPDPEEDEFEFCDCGEETSTPPSLSDSVHCDIDWECCPGQCPPVCWTMPLYGLGCMAGCDPNCYTSAEMCYTGGGNWSGTGMICGNTFTFNLYCPNGTGDPCNNGMTLSFTGCVNGTIDLTCGPNCTFTWEQWRPIGQLSGCCGCGGPCPDDCENTDESVTSDLSIVTNLSDFSFLSNRSLGLSFVSDSSQSFSTQSALSATSQTSVSPSLQVDRSPATSPATHRVTVRVPAVSTSN